MTDAEKISALRDALTEALDFLDSYTMGGAFGGSCGTCRYCMAMSVAQHVRDALAAATPPAQPATAPAAGEDAP